MLGCEAVVLSPCIAWTPLFEEGNTSMARSSAKSVRIRSGTGNSCGFAEQVPEQKAARRILRRARFRVDVYTGNPSLHGEFESSIIS